MLSSLRRSRYYRILLWSVAALCFAFFFLRGMSIVVAPEWISTDDFVEYWSAGQLNFRGENPYDPALLKPLQNQAGRYFGVPVMMWNPPFMLALVMPFGLLDYPFSRVLWFLFHLLIVVVCVDRLWIAYGGRPGARWVSWAVAFIFMPFIGALRAGQTGALLLLGAFGFLYFIRKEKDGVAGAFLALLLIKPHVLYLFAIAVLVWSIDRRRWSVLLGWGAALLIATALAWVFNTRVLDQYVYATLNYPPEDIATPTLGGLARMLVGTENFWLQFVPSGLGLIWLIYYWLRHRSDWIWLRRAPLVILVSLLTTAYGWSHDQTVALVAVVQVFVLLASLPLKMNTALVVAGYLMINLLNRVMPDNEFYLFWLATAVLLWYLGSRWLVENRSKSPGLNPAGD